MLPQKNYRFSLYTFYIFIDFDCHFFGMYVGYVCSECMCVFGCCKLKYIEFINYECVAEDTLKLNAVGEEPE